MAGESLIQEMVSDEELVTGVEISHAAQVGSESSASESFSEFLEENISGWESATYPAAPSTVIDLPEVISIDSEFFYNYYTRDERTVSTGVESIIDISSSEADIEFVKKRSRTARSVIIKIRVPSAMPYTNAGSTFLYDYVNSNMNSSDFLSENKDKIVFEGAVANSRFSSVILMDNQLDTAFYHALTSSVAFEDTLHNSPMVTDANSELTAFLSSPFASISGATNIVRKALGNLQPMGVAYAPTDARQEIVTDALRSVRFVEFNSTINNAVISNMTLAALEDRGNIYQDELLGIADDAEQIQTNYVQNSNPSNLSTSEFELELAATDVFVKSEVIDQGFTINESSIAVGLYIEKFEIQSSDDGKSWTRKELEPIIISNYGNFNIFDSDIKYGASYVYKVKIIHATAYEATAVDPDGLTQDEEVFAVSLIASRGVSTKVSCVETIAPKPPQNIRFKYNFQNNTLTILWEEPSNPQRDVVRYQIFRRASTDLPFTLLGELDFDNSTSRVVPLEKAPPEKIFRVAGQRKIFVDVNYNRDKNYIYAIACVDARGLTSGYSEQILVSYDKFKNKINSKSISKPNAPKPYPNMYLEGDFFVDTMRSSGETRMRIFFDPEYYKALQTESDGTSLSEIDLGLIGDKYKLHIINLDLQDSQVFDIEIGDETGPPMEVPVTEANITSL